MKKTGRHNKELVEAIQKELKLVEVAKKELKGNPHQEEGIAILKAKVAEHVLLLVLLCLCVYLHICLVGVEIS